MSSSLSPLQQILTSYRADSMTEREKGTYFEELIRTYFRHEPRFADLYSDVWLFSDWAKEHGFSAKDTGIDLVAKTRGTEEFHAIQCKCYAENHRVQKKDIDSFFTASGQKPFVQRIIVTTTNDWSENAENALIGQTPPVYKIDLHDLETSQIDWARYQPSTAPALKSRKSLRPHQISAKGKVVRGFETEDRGKLIMACGTGKTFTSLKIAEDVAGPGKITLFLVPSLNLLSQTLTEWTQESAVPLHSFAVCSDAEVGKKRKDADEDVVETFAHELRYPATTDARRLAEEFSKRHDAHHMSVIFSTYHSLEVISRAQHQFGLPAIDLVICDEAHRTTGASFERQEESSFVKVHDNEFLRAAKRLYMTATPRIYGDVAKATAEKDNTILYDMNDEAQFGKQLHVITFSEAVQLKLLTDYKVLVLTISEEHVSSRIQELLKDENNQLKVDDAARIIGCWKALSKQGLAEDLSGDAEPMRRAVAFCQVIERSNGRSHKVSSKQIASMFSAVVKAYQEQENSDNDLLCEAAHVDGSMNATEKEQKLEWIKAEPPPNTCRILSNVRCLSEGVDVPALDAVLFLTPRNSQVDVVQSVGRVMRNAPGKKRGYVILPVVIPVGMEPHEALNDNKVYKVVWQVLQALRSHDDTFDAMINKIDLTGHDTRKMEVIAITDKAQKKSATTKNASSNVSAKGQSTIGSPETPYRTAVQTDLQFEVGDLERALYAKVVKKCGNPNHWEDWANDIAKIANTHISRITQIVSNPSNTKECEAFQAFAYELRDDLNDSITDTEVIEMLAQHLITKPVFDALFEDYSFASHNPVSQAMQHVLEVLQEHRLEKEADTLEKFYASVKMRAANIHDVTAKQKIVVELYDKFFRNAFPKMTERLGIVYTPVEVVDFIIHSVNELLQQEFGQTLGSKGVHIIDPFTGTGTFITRLLQSGLISPEQLPHKYQHEIHANEIVLLAYYIAAINIEAVYHALMKGHAAASSSSQSKIQNQQSSIGNPAFTSPAPTGRKTIAQGNALGPDPTTDLSPVGATQSGIPYEPFQGICLTDTFRLGEEDLISSLLHNNSERRKRQQQLDVRVIIGNPPYSIGQASENDNAANVEYPELDLRIRQTYAEKSSAILQKGIYDSYVRAMRWASDRIGESGVIGYVTNAGFLEGATADGLRKSLVEEFSKIYVFHLRGNARTSGEQRRKERDNVFGQGTRTPIAITILVKNPQSKNQGQIYWCDIGDYLSLDEKLGKISAFVSIAGICTAGEWRSIVPDQHGDWINQRDNSFGSHIVMGSKELTDQKVFEKFSLGVVTNRDAWTTNYSKSVVTESISRLIKNYQAELSRIILSNHTGDVSNFVDSDPEKISWTRSLKNDLRLRKSLTIEDGCLTCFCYRPFTKTWRFYSRRLNEMVNSMPKCFPINSSASNLVIAITGTGTPKDFSAFITDTVPDLQLIANGQCFPLYLYEKTEASTADGDLFASQANGESYTRRDAITDAGLAHFQAAFPAAGEGSSITKEDLFYYIYGLLHSPDYRSRYADNLSKELPRIPAVKSYADFRAFEKAGSALAHWHLNYETVDCHPAIKVEIAPSAAEKLPATELYRVTKMKFAKRKDPNTGKSLNDKTTVIYNDYITLRNIPLEAYDYVVNGKPALEWVMERQSVTTDKDSGITNDANLYATETMQNPKYPLELLLRVCTVSEETNKIVASLPALNI